MMLSYDWAVIRISFLWVIIISGVLAALEIKLSQVFVLMEEIYWVLVVI